jgi:GNAT superfamily N-acetyltransferase
VREASESDLQGILGVQHRAFGRVAAEFDIDPSRLPPLTESLDDLFRLLTGGVRFFVAGTIGGAIIGSVRGSESEGTVEIGRLVVDDEWLRMGVASALMDGLEAAHPHAHRFVLFTGAEATVPLALYSKRGYREFRRERLEAFELVWLERDVGRALQ